MPAFTTFPIETLLEPTALSQSTDNHPQPNRLYINRNRRDLPDHSLDSRHGGGEDSSPCLEDDLRRELCSDGKIDRGVLSVNFQQEEEHEADADFADACEAMSVASSSDVDDFAKHTALSPKSVVFFDADEEFFSDGSVSSTSSSRGSTTEVELRTLRLALHKETERRRAAEDAVNRMCSQWQRIGRKLSEYGLTFPTPSPSSHSLELEVNHPVEQTLQELVVTRFVSEAIGMVLGRADAENDASAIIHSKDQEISRLRDRLKYYETVNQQMSLRNLELVETARRQSEKQNHQRWWVWGCIGLSITIGASVIAYTFFPPTSTSLNASSGPASATSSTESA